jgi:hypothetical protein
MQICAGTSAPVRHIPRQDRLERPGKPTPEPESRAHELPASEPEDYFDANGGRSRAHDHTYFRSFQKLAPPATVGVIRCRLPGAWPCSIRS